MNLAIITAHAGADSLDDAMCSWTSNSEPLVGWTHSGGIGYTDSKPPIFVINGDQGILPAYQAGFLHVTADIQAYLHDDTIIKDPEWVYRVMREFEDPGVGLVGLGGALGHGHPEMYKIPYNYYQLARHDFMSNMEDAENHGKRFTGSCDVAVLDGFALILRRELLERAGGWPLDRLGYIGYDYWISCIARRMGYRSRLVGIRCNHLGGRTFVKLGIGQDTKHWQQYLDAHKYIYDEFKDVLPFRV